MFMLMLPRLATLVECRAYFRIGDRVDAPLSLLLSVWFMNKATVSHLQLPIPFTNGQKCELVPGLEVT